MGDSIVKARDSGMPDEAVWKSFFEPEVVLDRLQLVACDGDVVEFGCGYGTFSLPAARRTTGNVLVFDIEPAMVARVQAEAERAQLGNVRAIERDFISHGTGLADDAAVYAMLFNLLHAEEPERLLREARRVLRPGGLLGILHWNYDASTPRGPSLAIRPRPEQCREWAQAAGFTLVDGPLSLPPYHYGLVMRK